MTRPGQTLLRSLVYGGFLIAALSWNGPASSQKTDESLRPRSDEEVGAQKRSADEEKAVRTLADYLEKMGSRDTADRLRADFKSGRVYIGRIDANAEVNPGILGIGRSMALSDTWRVDLPEVTLSSARFWTLIGTFTVKPDSKLDFKEATQAERDAEWTKLSKTAPPPVVTPAVGNDRFLVDPILGFAGTDALNRRLERGWQAFLAGDLLAGRRSSGGHIFHERQADIRLGNGHVAGKGMAVDGRGLVGLLAELGAQVSLRIDAAADIPPGEIRGGREVDGRHLARSIERGVTVHLPLVGSVLRRVAKDRLLAV